MRKREYLMLVFLTIVCACESRLEYSYEDVILGGNEQKATSGERCQWVWLKSFNIYNVTSYLVCEELFGEKGNLRLHQSMCIYDDLLFCFNHGDECHVIDFSTKDIVESGLLPDNSHHNNAQFLDNWFVEDDRFPLLLLSCGNYPPNRDNLYVVRIVEKDSTLSFSIIKTIKNNIPSAQNNGSWIADTDNNRLYLYCMTKSDWRTKKENYFCIFSFDLPNLTSDSEAVLSMDDVRDYWEYPYMIHQGGRYHNGCLLFNVQSLSSINGYRIKTDKCVLAINADNGEVEAIMPIKERMETEGICVYQDRLYISFKDGDENQKKTNVVFKVNSYSMPESFI